MKPDQLVKVRVGGVTILRPAWLDVGVPVRAQPVVKEEEVQPATPLSFEQKQKMLRILGYLRDEYSVGMTVLERRALGFGSDLRSKFKTATPTESGLVSKIAAAIGVTVDELYAIEDFTFEREAQLRQYLKQAHLIETRASGGKRKAR